MTGGLLLLLLSFIALGASIISLIDTFSEETTGKIKKRKARITRHFILIIITIIVMFPILLVFLSAFRTTIIPVVPNLLEADYTMNNFIFLFEKTNFYRWFGNTLFVSFGSVALTLLMITPSAYAFSRLEFTGRNEILFIIVLTQVFPLFMGMVAVYALFNAVGLYANYPEGYIGLMLFYAGGNVPFYTWYLKGYMDSLPTSIDEAARLDGADQTGIFTDHILPLSKPTLGVISFLSFIVPYNDPIFPSVVFNDSKNQTLVVGIWESMMRGEYTPPAVDYDFHTFGVVASAILIGAIPLVVIFVTFQKYLVEQRFMK